MRQSKNDRGVTQSSALTRSLALVAWIALGVTMAGCSALPGADGGMFNMSGGDSGVGRELGSTLGATVGGRGGYAGALVGGMLGQAVEKGSTAQRTDTK